MRRVPVALLLFKVFILSSIASLWLLMFSPLPLHASASSASQIEPNEFQIRIAKGYSSKFCNAIAMGMTKQSSLMLAISENEQLYYNPSLWFDLLFSSDREHEHIDDNVIKSRVASDVINTCGGSIDYTGFKGQILFEEFIDEIISLKAE